MHRTDRLILRPGNTEDAPALFSAIAEYDIVRNLSSAPWPYSIEDAEKLASASYNPQQPRLFIFINDSETPQLIGIAGLDLMPGGELELGYWIAKRHWNRGYASEVGLKMIDIARNELKARQLVAGYFVDNPASGRVLGKLGFIPTGTPVDRTSRARNGAAPCQMCTLNL